MQLLILYVCELLYAKATQQSSPEISKNVYDLRSDMRILYDIDMRILFSHRDPFMISSIIGY